MLGWLYRIVGCRTIVLRYSIFSLITLAYKPNDAIWCTLYSSLIFLFISFCLVWVIFIFAFVSYLGWVFFLIFSLVSHYYYSNVLFVYCRPNHGSLDGLLCGRSLFTHLLAYFLDWRKRNHDLLLNHFGILPLPTVTICGALATVRNGATIFSSDFDIVSSFSLRSLLALMLAPRRHAWLNWT